MPLVCPPGSWARGFGPKAGCTGQGELSPTAGTDTRNLSGCNTTQLCLSHHGARAWTGGAGWLRTPLNADCGLLTLMFQWLKQVTGLSHREESGGQHDGGHLSGAPREPHLVCVCTSTGHHIPDRERQREGSCLSPMPLEQLPCVEVLRPPGGDTPGWGAEASCPNHHVAHLLWPPA